MNGRANCILQVCCRQADAEVALADQMVEDLSADTHEAKKYAKWMHANFDLAPKGTLQSFKDAIATLAREPQA